MKLESKIVFNLAHNDEAHLNRHIQSSGVTITVLERGGREGGVTYSVDGDEASVSRFMGKIDGLSYDLVEWTNLDRDLGASAALGVLDQSVTKLRKALATGDYDMYLEALLDAEQAGKTRKTAVEALEERIGGA